MKRRERLVSEVYDAQCRFCPERRASNNGPKIRVWLRRHVESTGHEVDLTFTSVRRYKRGE